MLPIKERILNYSFKKNNPNIQLYTIYKQFKIDPFPGLTNFIPFVIANYPKQLKTPIINSII